jgi:uncharacterized protein (TIGR03032 family)
MNSLHKKQDVLFRDPAQAFGLWAGLETNPKVLESRPDRGWKETLKRLGVTLLVTREYEHLVLALGPKETSWLPLPHPSGLAVDQNRQTVHIACTRNPNILMELLGETLFPSRIKVLPGSLYLHDLALIQGNLYGNAVGHNAVVRLGYDQEAKRVWWPRCIEKDKPVFHQNHLQLNSIAAGKTLSDSFFSASSGRMLKKVPGDKDFPVDRTGVIFSGRSREPMAFGLTRPHSARLHGGELWVDNSGYGQVGRISEGCFHPLVQLEGWTRGLCIIEDVLFAGISRVLPRFHVYAPGLDHRKSRCGLAAIRMTDGKILGQILWPYGNQIFAIDWLKNARFPYHQNTNARTLFYSRGKTGFISV